jgi:hypothetical protein
MKKLAKDICRKWADERRQQILLEEIMSGAALKKPTLKPRRTGISEQFELQARIGSPQATADDATGSKSRQNLLEEHKGTELNNSAPQNAGGGTRQIRSNVYSQVESTGIQSRDALRRKLVKIFRDDLALRLRENDDH